jgi:hypothetical protein
MGVSSSTTRVPTSRTDLSGINIELFGGPDVYFVASFAGTPILTEHQIDGRAKGRANAHTCLCVKLCTDNLPHTPPEKVPHWTKVASRFNVHTAIFDVNNNFLPDGYAGQATEAYVFGGGVTLNGNCPFKNSAAPAHGLKYRFLAAEWGYSAPGPRPGVMPTISPLPSPTSRTRRGRSSPAVPPGRRRLLPGPRGPLPFRKMSVYSRPTRTAGSPRWLDLTVPLTAGGTTP